MDSVPGTYWWTDVDEGSNVMVEFSTNKGLVVRAQLPSGKNDCGALLPLITQPVSIQDLRSDSA